MKRTIVAFVGGVLVMMLLVALLASATWWGDKSASAQDGGTWQVKIIEGGPFGRLNGGNNDPDPDLYLDDWVAALPIDCDFQLLTESEDPYVFYRCP